MPQKTAKPGQQWAKMVPQDSATNEAKANVANIVAMGTLDKTQ